MGKEDPMHVYYRWGRRKPGKSLNRFGVNDPVLDNLLDQVAAEINFVKRKQIFKQVVLRVREKAYLLPYVSRAGAIVWTQRLQNVQPLDHFHFGEAMAAAWLD